MKRVLFAIGNFNLSHEEITEILSPKYFDLIFNDQGTDLNYTKWPEMFAEVDYILAGLEFYSGDFFMKYPRVKCLSRIGVGTDNIDLDAARASGTSLHHIRSTKCLCG